MKESIKIDIVEHSRTIRGVEIGFKDFIKDVVEVNKNHHSFPQWLVYEGACAEAVVEVFDLMFSSWRAKIYPRVYRLFTLG